MRRRGPVPEWAKDVLIAALSLSAVYLFTLSPLYLNSPLRGWTGRLFAPAGGEGTGLVSFAAAARPARMVVTNSLGRSGAQYDTAAVDALFEQTGALLGEALASAGTAAPISPLRWRRALEGEGIYFDFTGSIPLSALSGWLRDGEANRALSGDARRLLLAPGDGGELFLYYQDGWDPNLFYARPTPLSAASHLDPLTAACAPNGAKFAFEDGELSQLDPYTLITGGPAQAEIFGAASPLAAGGEAAVLESLSFSGALVTSYLSAEGTVYRMGEDALLLARDGSVTYRGADGALYPVVCEGERPTVAESIETTRRLVSAAVEPLCGDARVYLISARQEGEETVITYGYSLGGAPVWLAPGGWAAQFRLTGGALTQFTLRLRSYAARGETIPLPPAAQAAAAMEALDAGGRELVRVYHDAGGDTVTARLAAA